MIRTIKIIIYITAAALLAWALPWLWHFALNPAGRTPFTLYSGIEEKFVYAEGSGKERVFGDFAGKTYTERQYDSIIPFFNYRQLLKDGRLSDTIRGMAVNPQSIARGNFIFRHSPQNINVHGPELYPLLESMSGRVSLAMPEDVFRLGDDIEFVDIKTNLVDTEKSGRFNRAMLDKGFVFPATGISGNPTARKEYDEGYIVIDSEHKVFHLKMNAGRPFFRDTGIPAELGMKHAFITEFPNHSMLGFFSDRDNNFYVLELPSYELKRLPVGNFDPERENMMIIGDMMNWTVKVNGPEREVLYAVNAGDYSLADYYEFPQKTDKWNAAAAYLFPFGIAFSSYADKYVRPRIIDFSWKAIFLNIALAAAYLLIRRKQPKRHIVQAAAIIPLGLFMFIPLLVMDRE